MVGEAAGRVVELVGGDADVEQDAVHTGDPPLGDHPAHLGEIGLHHLGGKAGQAPPRFGHGVGIPVKGDEAAGCQPGGDGKGVPAAACRAVEVNPSGPDSQRIQRLIEQHRQMIALFGSLRHDDAAFP